MNPFGSKPTDGDDYERRPPFFVLLGALLLYFVRFGYDYANSDQDEVIPYLMHRLDPGLFTQDWFVGIQVSEFSVRTYFVWLLNALALLLPIWLSVLIVYVVTWLFIAGAVYKLTYHFTRDQIAACAAVVVALVLTPVWTLGGNDLVHSMLVASMVAWALGLWAIYHFLRARYLLSPVLLGIACWMQPLVGLHLAAILFLVRVLIFVRDRERVQTLSGIVAWGLFFVLWASPALGPVIYEQFFNVPANFDPEPSVFYILAEFRLPHHYLPGSFYSHNVIRFAGLGLLAAGGLMWTPFRRQLSELAFIFRVLAIVALFGIVGWLLTEVVPLLFVAKLQLFKMTVLAKLIFVIIICGAASYALPSSVRKILRAAARRPGWGITLTTVASLAVIGAAILGTGYLHDRIGPFERADAPIGRVQTWVERNAPGGSIFAIPPSLSTFRSEAQRTIVINFKAVPYEDEHMVEWFARLTDFAPVPLPERAGPEFMDDLDAAYESLDAPSLERLARTYEFDHVLRRTPLAPDQSSFEEAFTAPGWYVYRLRADTAPADPTDPGLEGAPLSYAPDVTGTARTR